MKYTDIYMINLLEESLCDYTLFHLLKETSEDELKEVLSQIDINFQKHLLKEQYEYLNGPSRKIDEKLFVKRLKDFQETIFRCIDMLVMLDLKLENDGKINLQKSRPYITNLYSFGEEIKQLARYNTVPSYFVLLKIYFNSVKQFFSICEVTQYMSGIKSNIKDIKAEVDKFNASLNAEIIHFLNHGDNTYIPREDEVTDKQDDVYAKHSKIASNSYASKVDIKAIKNSLINKHVNKLKSKSDKPLSFQDMKQAKYNANIELDDKVYDHYKEFLHQLTLSKQEAAKQASHDKVTKDLTLLFDPIVFLLASYSIFDKLRELLYFVYQNKDKTNDIEKKISTYKESVKETSSHLTKYMKNMKENLM